MMGGEWKRDYLEAGYGSAARPRPSDWFLINFSHTYIARALHYLP